LFKFFICEVFTPNRTFFVHFGSISGEFLRALVRILARPHESDMPPKCTKKVRLGIYCTEIFGQVIMISQPHQVSDLISQDIRTVDAASDWLIANLGYVKD